MPPEHNTHLQTQIVRQLYKHGALTQAYFRIRFNLSDKAVWDTLLLVLTHIGAVEYHRGRSYASSYLTLTGEAKQYLSSLLAISCPRCRPNGEYPETLGPVEECVDCYAKSSS